jgi:peptide/nickel transport system substrate-binding protein
MIRTRGLLAATLLATTALAPAVSAETLRWARAGDSLTLDPHAQNEGPTHTVAHQIYEPLLIRDMTGAFEPALATSWAPSPDDPNVWVFNLREGVKFHSGNDMTAEDVVWTIERLKSSADFKGIFSGWTSVEAIDDYTVEIKTDGPSPLVLHTATYVFPLDKKFYEEGGAEIAKHGDSFSFAASPPLQIWACWRR